MELIANYQTLIGQDVRLEPIADHHIAGLFAIGQLAEDWRYLGIPGFHVIEVAEQWVSEARQLAEGASQLTYVLVDPATSKPIGSSRFMNIRMQHRALEIGYSWLGRAYQRTSVNSEAKYLLLTHAFETLAVNRVEFKTDARNLQSQAAIERIGATREGVLRHHMIAQHGHVRDSVMYSIIRPEWPDIKDKLQKKMASYR